MSDNMRDTFSSHDFVFWVLSQIGGNFVFDAQFSPTNDPNQFNIAELVQWGCKQVGVFIPATADEQIAYAESKQRLISIEDAKRKRGAILWLPGQVAISIGGQRTIESVNGKVGLVRRTTTAFEKAAQLPGVNY